jgi:hypothetical protein
MFEPRPAALSVTCALVSILLIAACTSRPPPRGGQPGGPPGGGSPGGRTTSLNGGQVARPIALLFTGMDTGHDHAIGPAELTAGISEEWAHLPVSASGTVPAVAMSDWAMTALGNPEALPNHIAFDVNLDGQISEEEFRTRLTDEFDRLDRDHDGQLTRAEMLMDVPLRSQDSGGGMPGGGRPPGGGGGRPPR